MHWKLYRAHTSDVDGFILTHVHVTLVHKHVRTHTHTVLAARRKRKELRVRGDVTLRHDSGLFEHSPHPPAKLPPRSADIFGESPNVCMCMCMCVREREIERDRVSERERKRE